MIRVPSRLLIILHSSNCLNKHHYLIIAHNISNLIKRPLCILKGKAGIVETIAQNKSHFSWTAVGPVTSIWNSEELDGRKTASKEYWYQIESKAKGEKRAKVKYDRSWTSTFNNGHFNWFMALLERNCPFCDLSHG